jgi:hypothetical protein
MALDRRGALRQLSGDFARRGMGMATAAGEARQEVSIERIFGRAFGTIRSNPLATLGIAFLFSAVPTVALNAFVQGRQAELVTRIGGLGLLAFGLVMMAIGIVISAITQGALVRATVAHSQGRESSFAESISAGLTVIVPLFLTGLVSAIGIGLATILLIVPGVMLYCAWVVATPAVVAEGLWPLAALERSRELTSGARWKVFAILLILMVAYWILSGVVAALSIQFFGGLARFASLGAGGGFPVGYIALTGIMQTLVACVWGVAVTSIYVELRDWKDGPQTAALEQVFA